MERSHLSIFLFALIVLLQFGTKLVSLDETVSQERTVNITEFPFHVLFTHASWKPYSCSGSIIDSKWIITFKACISSSIKAIYIGLDRLTQSANDSSVEVKFIVTHPVGIALLRLSEPLQLNDKVQPIALSKEKITPKEARAVGFGLRREENALIESWPVEPHDLKLFEYQDVNEVDCYRNLSKWYDEVVNCSEEYHQKFGPRSVFPTFEFFHTVKYSYSICITRLKEHGIFAGDLGGPLFVTSTNGTRVLFGIAQELTPVPFGTQTNSSCNQDLFVNRTYATYIRISPYVTWINETMEMYSN